MSEAADAMRRLRSCWEQLAADDRIIAVVHFASAGIMAAAIVSQFGWSGATFLFGAFFWKVSDLALRAQPRSGL